MSGTTISHGNERDRRQHSKVHEKLDNTIANPDGAVYKVPVSLGAISMPMQGKVAEASALYTVSAVPHRAAVALHRRVVTTPMPVIARRVQEVLTPQLTAYITGVKTTKSIQQWLSGKGIRPYAEAALRTAFRVIETLSSMESDQTIRTWFIAANPYTGNATPMEALREGKHSAVLAAATHFAENG